MRPAIVLAATLALATLVGCGERQADDGHGHDHGAPAAEEFTRGPHGGRLLEGKQFNLELQILEGEVEPQYRAYLTRDGRPLVSTDAHVVVNLTRLGNRVQTITLSPEADYLTSPDVVFEPHSFAVTVEARAAGQNERWQYDSFEGRTEIAAAFAQRAGIETAKVGPGRIREQLRLHGQLELAPAGRADVRARFPGLVTAVQASPGQRVRRGGALAIVESNESLSRYAVTAPIDGIVAARSVNVGEQTADRVLFEIIDPDLLEAHLQVLAEDLPRLRIGQAVDLRLSAESVPLTGRIIATAPRANDASQSVEVRVALPKDRGLLRAGLAVIGDVRIAEHAAAMVVDLRALQSWRDMDVVFRRVGDIFEVQPIEIGRRDGQWVEVLSGIEPGAHYVTSQSYLIKADIEKSGAAHEH